MAQKKPKNKRKVPGPRIKPKEGLWIHYQLKLKGLSQQYIADELGITNATVNQVLYGYRKSKRVENAFCKALGYPNMEALIAASRGKERAA
jgi:hypothetical protein